MSGSLLALRPACRLIARPGVLPLGAVFGGLTLAACAGVGLFGLDRLGFTFCFFKLTTGLPCPTCGSTRALGRLAHLDLAGALAMNPLAALAALGLLLWGLLDLALLPRGRASRLAIAPRWQGPARVVILGALVLNWTFLLALGR
jgi:hypothetical protein